MLSLYSPYDIFRHVWKPPTGRLQILYMKCIHPHTSNAMILNGKLLILLSINGNIIAHTWNHWNTHCILHFICSRTTSVTTFISLCVLWFGKHSNTEDAKKIILWCCTLPTHTCNPRSLGVSNTNRCESHQKGTQLPSLCMLHHTLNTSLFMSHTMPWNGKPSTQLLVNGNLGTLHSWKQYKTHTHTHHFTFQSTFLKALPLKQTEQLCDCIHYLTIHIIMKALVKIVHSILHHHN
jgi:hypothetical protein